MKVTVLIPLLLIIGYSALSPAQSLQTNTQAHFTRTELRQQIKNAHNPEQYQALADYFRQQQTSFLNKAAEEKLLWDARAQNVTASGQKYPRPVDSAHYLYDSYSHDAEQSGKLADHYDQLGHTVASLTHPISR
jgi:hypothetical protein